MLPAPAVVFPVPAPVDPRHDGHEDEASEEDCTPDLDPPQARKVPKARDHLEERHAFAAVEDDQSHGGQERQSRGDADPLPPPELAAIAFLALVGAALQDRKKDRLMGQVWSDWRSKTSFVPYGRGLKSAGGFALRKLWTDAAENFWVAFLEAKRERYADWRSGRR